MQPLDSAQGQELRQYLKYFRPPSKVKSNAPRLQSKRRQGSNKNR
jgi:hypothetical protein